MVGQVQLTEQLRMVLRGARLRGVPTPHVLLDGPAGFGKTSLAQVIAAELEAPLVVVTGMMMRRPADMTGILLRLPPRAVLFIDEVHAAAKAVLEVLYTALEDGVVPVMLGAGADARAHQYQLQAWTCVAATTAPGMLTEPFRSRFGFKGTMAPYSVDELGEIVRRVWDKHDVDFEEGEPFAIAERCKGVPRIALHLADRVLDWAYCQGTERVSEGVVADALEAFGIDAYGFDEVDRRILTELTTTFAGRTVGVEALAQSLGMDRSALEAHEGPLVTKGLVSRTTRGRMALPAAYNLAGVSGGLGS